jgi:AP-3 complex subunit beta
MDLSAHPSELVAAEAVVVLRALVQQRPQTHGGVVLRLVKRLDTLAAPAARAAVVWLAAADLGAALPAEEAAKLRAAAPHALRLVTRSFGEEAEATKLALLGAAAKLLLRGAAGPEGGLLYGHVLALADVDMSFDVRDRARLLRALLPPPTADGQEAAPSPLHQHAAAVLLCAMPPPPLPSPAALRCTHMLNSLSFSVQHTAPGYAPLPPHPEVPPPSSVRAAPARPVPQAKPAAGGQPAAGRRSSGRAAAPGADGFYSSDGSESGSASGSGSYSDSYTESGDYSEDEEEESGAEGGEEAAEEAVEEKGSHDPRAWGDVPEEAEVRATALLKQATLEETAA